MNALLFHSSTLAIIKSSRTKANNNGVGGNDASGSWVGGGVHTKINDVTVIAKAKVFFSIVVVVVSFIFLFAVSNFF